MLNRKQYDAVFKALGDTTRRRILDLLKKKPRTTGELCGHFRNLDRCTVMQHLGVLERAELIIVKRNSRFRWNHLNVGPFQEIYNRWIHPYSFHAASVLSRMKQDLEQSPETGL